MQGAYLAGLKSHSQVVGIESGASTTLGSELPHPDQHRVRDSDLLQMTLSQPESSNRT